MKIRKPRRDELPGCVALARRCFARERYGREAYSDLLLELRRSLNPNAYERSHYFVATDGDTLAGLAGYRQSGLDWGTYELFWIGVSPAYQGRGIGKMLVAHLERHLRRYAEATGTLTVLLACTKDLESFYSVQGYHTVLTKGRGNGELLMAKLLRK